MILIVCAAYSHVPVYNMLITRSTSKVCTSIDPIYSKINAIFLVIFLAYLPPMLMTICCITTLILLRRQRRRVMPINQVRLRQRDTQLFKMLLLYVAFHIISTTPFSTVLLIAVYQLPNPSPTVLLLYRLFVLLFNASFSISFYIYTMGTPFYRQEFYRLIIDTVKHYQRMIRPNYNQARPRMTINTPFKRS
ncbi:hypothetical protein I4U23_008782 [Adineta vaga]|nr:hypothetical protein I4U23_008782 [Adineta vaga]